MSDTGARKRQSALLSAADHSLQQRIAVPPYDGAQGSHDQSYVPTAWRRRYDNETRRIYVIHKLPSGDTGNPQRFELREQASLL